MRARKMTEHWKLNKTLVQQGSGEITTDKKDFDDENYTCNVMIVAAISLPIFFLRRMVNTQLSNSVLFLV